MNTPSPSQWFNNSETMMPTLETQDYFTGTQPERERRSHTDYFEGVTGEANRPWTQYKDNEEEEEEEEDNAETVDNTVVSKQTAPTQRRKTATGGKKATTQSPRPTDLAILDKANEIKYRLLTKCFYEGKSVHTGRQNPIITGDLGSAIRICSLIDEEQTRAKAYADGLGFACQRVSIRAVASHQRTTAKEKVESELDVENTQSFWDQLEDDIRRWFDQKKTDLTITLTSNWGRRSDGVIPTATESIQNETSSSTNKPKNTSTVRLQGEMGEYRARQTPAQQLHQELLLKWRCLKAGCNDGHHCYVDGKDEHIPLTPINCMFWAREIEREGSGITQERPSNQLLAMIKEEKKKHQKRDKKARGQLSLTPATTVPPGLTAPGPTINYYIGQGAVDQDPTRQRSTTRYVSATPHRTVSVSAPPPPQTNPPSSPVRGEYTMKDYIDWHIEKQPNRKEVLMRAYDRLEENCYMIHHIQGWKDTTNSVIAAQWEKLGIPLGLGRQLAEEASVFGRECEPGHASSPALAIRASPRKQDTWQHPAQRRQSVRPVMRSIEGDSGSATEDEESQNYGGNNLGGEDLDDSQALLM